MESRDRVVIAPSAGVFEPSRHLIDQPGSSVSAGDVVGSVCSGNERVDVVSSFVGDFRDMLAWQGERVRRHQPLVWLEVA